jgi:hypothetical protein
VVMVNFPSSVAELDELEGQHIPGQVQYRAQILCALQLFSVGDALKPAASKLGAKGRLKILLEDPNRKGKGGISIAPQLEQAVQALQEVGLKCSEIPYPSTEEAEELISSATRFWLVRRQLRKQLKIFQASPTSREGKIKAGALRWAARAKETVRVEALAQASFKSRSTENSFLQRDNMLSGHGRALRFLRGSVGNEALRIMKDEQHAYTMQVLAGAVQGPQSLSQPESPRRHLMTSPRGSRQMIMMPSLGTSRQAMPSPMASRPTSPRSARLTFFSPQLGYAYRHVQETKPRSGAATARPRPRSGNVERLLTPPPSGVVARSPRPSTANAKGRRWGIHDNYVERIRNVHGVDW